MTEPVDREEYLNAIGRVHSRIDTVEKTTASIETSAKSIEKSVCEMHKIMYGNAGADGLVTKVSNLKQKLSGIFWLGGVIIIATIGALVGLIFKK